MKKVLVILVLSMTIVAYATFTGAGVRFARPLHPQVNTVGLIAHYKMWDGLMTTDEIFDYTLNGNGGTLQDTGATLIPTFPGFYFDGVEDYISIADDTSFSPGDGATGTPFSISAWIKMVDATEFIITTKGVYNTDAEWRFATETNDYLYMLFFDESVADCYIGRIYQTALSQNEWLHVVGTYDGGKISLGINLYLDSVNVDNQTIENAAASFVAIENDLGHAVHLNRDAATYGDGYIDDVMFFNIELTAIEVKNIYEVTRWRYQK